MIEYLDQRPVLWLCIMGTVYVALILHIVAEWRVARRKRREHARRGLP